MDDASLERVVREAVRDLLGWGTTRMELVAPALGTRRFARVWLEDSASCETLVARVDAPEDPSRRPAGIPGEPPLEPIRALLANHGLPVPNRLAGDSERGVELLEDLGERSLTDAAKTANGEELAALYTEACQLVARLQRIDRISGVAAFDRRLDDVQFAYKAQRFARYSPRAGRGATPAETEVIHRAFALVAREMASAPKFLAHRDFQSANLLFRGSALVMIDLQGAFLAPPEYDLVCLLRDSYVELPGALLGQLQERARPDLPNAPEPDVFDHRFDLLTLTRKGKDHALYRYAAVELGDARYLIHQPATTRYLKAASFRAAQRDPAFAALDEIIQALEDESLPGASPCGR